jgi:hypothetical protein
MKNIHNIILSFVLLTGLVACDTFLDVNSNPNSPIAENLPLSAKLPGALVSTVNQESLQLNSMGAFWAGYWGTNNEGINQFFDLKTYNGLNIRSQREGIPVWENGFNNILFFKLIEEEALESGQFFYSGVSKIMQGWLFLRLVDVYNNIPFDEAAQGNNILNPKYEAGQEVYKKSLELISLGIEEVKMSGILPQTHGDILFEGDKELWAKFGNTVKLRALVRQSQQGDHAYIQNEILKISNEGSGFLGIGESATVNPGYLNTAGKLNPFWAAYYRDVQGNTLLNYQIIRPTTFLLEQYSRLQDPRISQLYLPVNGSYKGVLFGNMDGGNAQYDRDSTSAFLGPVENGGQATGLFHNWNQSSMMLSDFESLFLQAEASHRGWIQSDTETLYKNAIAQSFDYLKVPIEKLEEYYSQQTVSLASANEPLRNIILQKWLALNSINSFEAWSDFRRLGIPEIPGTVASGVTGRPQRLMYPETEIGTNNQQVQAQGSDDMTRGKIWWMP